MNSSASSASAETAPTSGPSTVHDCENQISEGKGSDDLEQMYRAAFEGNWAAAERLLNQDPTRTLAYQLEEGNRPLHVAVALKHDAFARKLIEMMEPHQLELEDSDDLTACCYAASLGMLETCQLMIQKNRNLLKNPFHLQSAMLNGKSDVVAYFLAQTGRDCLPPESWLELLQIAIATKMNDVASKIMEKDGSVATMKNGQGTALHVLARQDISEATTGKMAILFKSIFGTTLKGRRGQGEMQPDFRSLAKKLLSKIQEKKDQRSELELLKKPPILHDAAKVGNVELIIMLTDTYPDLIWDTDEDKCSVFHVAIKNREAEVFALIKRLGAFKNYIMFQTDKNKDNPLHLAAYLGPRKTTIPALQMESELAWFKEVERMLPPGLIDSKNTKNCTPRELFSEQHKELLRESKVWMKSTADSCMLIATIILTVVYSAAFTVPGGTSDQTGLPILVKGSWLTCFFIFEALALFSSTLCIITFWSITTSGFEEDQFLNILPYQLKLGFTSLFGSLVGAISAFMSAYHLVLVEGRAWLVKSILFLIYAILILAMYGRFRELWLNMNVPKSLPRMLSKGNSQPHSSGDDKTGDKA